MRTKQDYIKGLSRMKRNLYFDGQLLDRTDELQKRCLDVIGTTVPYLCISHQTERKEIHHEN